MAAVKQARATGAMLGFRRVRCVVLHHDDTGTHAEIVGIAHRSPRRLPVPLSVAARLAADGVPVLDVR